MENLHWQLSVLSKAVHYKNLSGAASHVGLSQPQLSRIVAKLEQELGLLLLDRTARRKSGWTPIAYKLADTYFRSSRKLTQSLQQLKSDETMSQISIGILEGLIPLANDCCLQIFDQLKVHLIELNVYDLSELEERFEKDELDLVLTCREPGKHKYRFVRNLGYQIIETAGPSGSFKVFSQFEYASHINSKKHANKDARILVSNSLALRKTWIDEHRGSGHIPSEVRKRKSSDADVPVVLIASDFMSPAIWQRIEQFKF
jgi:hypothetical protein